MTAGPPASSLPPPPSAPPGRRLPELGAPPAGTPSWLPLAYFGAAAGWLALGAAGLLVVAPDLARGVLFAPRVFATVHLFALGLLASAVFGALHQFVPVVLGVGPRQAWVATWGFWLFEAGVLLLVSSLWWWRPRLQGLAWAVLFLGVSAASWNTLPARRRARQNRYVGTYVSLGHSALGLAMLLALARIGAGLGWWLLPREGLLAAHFHLGALGLGSLTALGVGSKMLPAFLGSRTPAAEPARWIGVSLGLGLLVFAAATAAGAGRGLTGAGAALMLVGVAGHLATLGRYFRTRTARLDPGLALIAAAAAFYALTATAGVLLLLRGSRPGTAWVAYGVLGLVGWLGLLVIGVMHRVVPRILTIHLMARGRRLSPEAQRGHLLSTPLAWASASGLIGGTALVAMAVIAQGPELARAAAAVFGVGVALLLGQGLRLAGAGLRKPNR